MCGVVGILGRAGVKEQLLWAMVGELQHRGPDGRGVWVDEVAGVGFGHTRLSIIDLSDAGQQPMDSASGRYVITYNGEIYNHADLRQELQRRDEHPSWRGHSDTESLLAGFDAWGIEETIKKTVGMFAFAVWDRKTRILILGRDRLGEKPLYYGWQGDSFLFGSELKALKSHPAFRAEIDREAVALLMRHSYIPAPTSIYRGISKLCPGTLLAVSLTSPNAEPKPYWNAMDVAAGGMANPFSGSPDEAVTLLETKLKKAVKRQMAADVPLGAFLSGGVDSSTVVALMQAQSHRPVRTFTIGSYDTDLDEAVHAKAVARHLGTDHAELYVSAKQALDTIACLPTLYCEPFADSSQIPTLLLSKLARQHVTVSLSGDGGDELFGGYNRYILAQRLWGKLARLPLSLRLAYARLVATVTPQTWGKILNPIQSFLPLGLAQAHVGLKMHKSARVVRATSPLELYKLMVSHWTEDADLVVGNVAHNVPKIDTRSIQAEHYVEQMMVLDLVSYLPGDILCKVDRAAMAVSLETRMPYLDPSIVEFAWRLPFEYKIRNGYGKWALRQVLYKYVPKELIERPKMGFGVPLGSWLRGPLRDWAEDLIDENRMREENYLNPAPIRRVWTEHLSGRQPWPHQLWNVLMFQAWLRHRHETSGDG
jgi:asparagine synthase (glutamine-hydrolysing)